MCEFISIWYANAQAINPFVVKVAVQGLVATKKVAEEQLAARMQK